MQPTLAAAAHSDADVLAAIEAVRSRSGGAAQGREGGHTLNPYKALIKQAGKQISCGRHPTAKAAALAYDEAASKIPGKRLNFPDRARAEMSAAAAAPAMPSNATDAQPQGSLATGERSAPLRPNGGRAPPAALPPAPCV